MEVMALEIPYEFWLGMQELVKLAFPYLIHFCCFGGQQDSLVSTHAALIACLSFPIRLSPATVGRRGRNMNPEDKPMASYSSSCAYSGRHPMPPNKNPNQHEKSTRSNGHTVTPSHKSHSCSRWTCNIRKKYWGNKNTKLNTQTIQDILITVIREKYQIRPQARALPWRQRLRASPASPPTSRPGTASRQPCTRFAPCFIFIFYLVFTARQPGQPALTPVPQPWRGAAAPCAGSGATAEKKGREGRDRAAGRDGGEMEGGLRRLLRRWGRGRGWRWGRG